MRTTSLYYFPSIHTTMSTDNSIAELAMQRGRTPASKRRSSTLGDRKSKEICVAEQAMTLATKSQRKSRRKVSDFDSSSIEQSDLKSRYRKSNVTPTNRLLSPSKIRSGIKSTPKSSAKSTSNQKPNQVVIPTRIVSTARSRSASTRSRPSSGKLTRLKNHSQRAERNIKPTSMEHKFDALRTGVLPALLRMSMSSFKYTTKLIVASVLTWFVISSFEVARTSAFPQIGFTGDGGMTFARFAELPREEQYRIDPSDSALAMIETKLNELGPGGHQSFMESDILETMAGLQWQNEMMRLFIAMFVGAMIGHRLEL